MTSARHQITVTGNGFTTSTTVRNSVSNSVSLFASSVERWWADSVVDKVVVDIFVPDISESVIVDLAVSLRRFKHFNVDFRLGVVSVQNVPDLVVAVVFKYVSGSSDGVHAVVDSSSVVDVPTGLLHSVSSGSDVGDLDDVLFVAGKVALLDFVEHVALLEVGLAGGGLAVFILFSPFTSTLITFPSQSPLLTAVNTAIRPS